MISARSRKTKIKFIGLILFFSIAGLLALAGQAKDRPISDLPLEIEAKVDRQEITIGDKVKYTIKVKADRDIEVEFPEFAGASTFAVKDFGHSAKKTWGKNIHRQWYVLDTYLSGEATIPAAIVKYRKKGAEQWNEAEIKEIKVSVKSLLAGSQESGQIRDIHGPRQLKGRGWFYLLLLTAGLLIFGLIAGFITIGKRKQVRAILRRPAHEIAYQALTALQNKGYRDYGNIKQYYIELSAIVRHYLENRFDIRAPEMTTDEFLSKVRDDRKLSPAHKNLLRDFLSNCDLVKFAKHLPRADDIESSFSAAKKLIDQTKEEDAVRQELGSEKKDNR